MTIKNNDEETPEELLSTENKDFKKKFKKIREELNKIKLEKEFQYIDLMVLKKHIQLLNEAISIEKTSSNDQTTQHTTIDQLNQKLVDAKYLETELNKIMGNQDEETTLLVNPNRKKIKRIWSENKKLRNVARVAAEDKKFFC